MMIAGTPEVRDAQGELFPPNAHRAGDAPEGLVSLNRRRLGDRALRIKPAEVVGDPVGIVVQREMPLLERRHQLKPNRTYAQIEAICCQATVGAHRGVLPTQVDDGERFRRAEVRVEGESRHQEEFA